jgi:hypothetical protein
VSLRAADCYVPLGGAADLVLVNESQVLESLRGLA